MLYTVYINRENWSKEFDHRMVALLKNYQPTLFVEEIKKEKECYKLVFESLFHGDNHFSKVFLTDVCLFEEEEVDYLAFDDEEGEPTMFTLLFKEVEVENDDEKRDEEGQMTEYQKLSPEKIQALIPSYWSCFHGIPNPDGSPGDIEQTISRMMNELGEWAEGNEKRTQFIIEEVQKFIQTHPAISDEEKEEIQRWFQEE